MTSTVQVDGYVAIRMQSGLHKVQKIVPDTTISLGKYGTFNSNLLIGRPYYLTFEIQDKAQDQSYSNLRIVPASELHAEALLDNEASSPETRDEPTDGVDAIEDEVVEENGVVQMKNNQRTVDDPSRQGLSLKEIEELKQSALGSGQEIIDKIMSAHSHLDEKTAFSLAKYIVRKRKKYLKRFTVLPLDVSMLATWMVNEKEPARTMELREESLGLMNAWANIHCFSRTGDLDDVIGEPQGRWLVVDDTGGLVVAALAEKMGILYPVEDEDHSVAGNDTQSDQPETRQDGQPEELQTSSSAKETSTDSSTKPQLPPDSRKARPDDTYQSSTSNILTLIHPATQPNISFLSYFSYDPSSSIPSILSASHAHPLHTHLHTLSFLQLLQPHLDTAYACPPPAYTADQLAALKTSKRSTYHRKRRRYERTSAIVDSTRAGNFDGLVVASATDPLGILDATVPLLRGGAQVVVYSPHVEPLVQLVDAYSSARKAALMTELSESSSSTTNGVEETAADIAKRILSNKDDYPVDPRLLLAPNLQTARAREYQVLPGRTHPLMTSKGGAEGYVFTATRVVPVEGKVEARGRFTKKRKVGDAGDGKGGKGKGARRAQSPAERGEKGEGDREQMMDVDSPAAK